MTNPAASDVGPQQNRSSANLPRQIGRYQILEFLGRGGMGSVYRAYDPGLGREVVVKLIPVLATGGDDEWRRRFQREVQTAGQLRHVNIVTVYDVDLDYEPPYVVMELLTGGTLKELLQQKSLSWREALVLLRPLVQALAYAHRKNVIHRDLKPANVMFAGDETNTLKLVDFGLARGQDEEHMTQTGIVMGTPTYMSPEQARAEPVDVRTDIFSFGIILFEAITGHNPLDRGSSTLTLLEVESDRKIDTAPLAGKAPPPVVRLIQRAIAKEPEQRYLDCQALLADLDRCLQSETNVSAAFFSIAGPAPPVQGPDIRLAGDITLTPEVEAVLQAMFSSFDQIAVEAEFGRGFSGSRAFRVRLIELNGRAHLPAAVKIAPRGLVLDEWRAYQNWVEHTLPNIARLDRAPLLSPDNQWGGLQYALVGSGTFAVQSLSDYYQEASVEDLCWVLENRLFEIMGPNWWLDNRTNRAFQMQTDYDILLPVNLMLKYDDSPPAEEALVIQPPGKDLLLASIQAGDPVQIKRFIVQKVDPRRQQLTLNLPSKSMGRPSDSYRVRLANVKDVDRFQAGEEVESIHGVVTATRQDALISLAGRALGPVIDLAAERLATPGKADLPNPLLAYQALLPDFITVNISTVHGDLNLENILVDPATREVSLIDFATVRQGHVLHDLLRLETEVLVMLIPPILAQTGLRAESIYPFYEQLHQITLESGWDSSPQLPHPALEKPFEMLRVIRKMVQKCLFNLDDWREYYRGLMLYLLGAMKFENLSNLPTAPLPRQVAFWGAASAGYFLERRQGRPEPEPARRRVDSYPSMRDVRPSEIEPPFGTMRPDSPLYIERAADDQCWQHTTGHHATTLFVQAPMQMGKSSLVRRILYRAQHQQRKLTAFIDFQKFTEQCFEDEESFFIELCLMIGDALGFPEAIDQYWGGRRTNIVKCSLYLSKYLIPKLSGPFILAMDEVERMLTSPFRANFFGMLRSWHNDRVFDKNFARMSLLISSSTDPYLLIDNPHQSPFNVATHVSLQDFSLDETYELNRRHNSPLSTTQVDRLVDLVNGHPFLTRLAFYQLALGEFDLPALLAQATEDAGPFGDHLRHYLRRVLQKPELKQALLRIVRDGQYEDDQIFFRLEGAGLVKREGKQVVFRNKLYERYFKERLNG